MADPNDQRPIRVMVFPQRRDVILIYVPEGQTLWMPPLKTPFDRHEIARTLGEKDVEARVRESTLGRFAAALTSELGNEKAEVGQRAKEKAAARRVDIVHSQFATSAELKRAELVKDKEKIDAELRDLKAEVSRAKALAHTRRVFEPTEQFQRKQRQIAELQTKSLAIQARLRELKEQVKADNVERSRDRNERFIRLVAAEMPEDMFADLWREVDAEERAELAAKALAVTPHSARAEQR